MSLIEASLFQGCPLRGAPLYYLHPLYCLPMQASDGAVVVEAPGGFAFHLHNEDSPKTGKLGSVRCIYRVY